jgi:hypothetical protein
MMLTNYPFDRELVAKRQRDQSAEAGSGPRARPSRPPRRFRLSTPRSKVSSWLARISIRRGEGSGAATA